MHANWIANIDNGRTTVKKHNDETEAFERLFRSGSIDRHGRKTLTIYFNVLIETRGREKVNPTKQYNPWLAPSHRGRIREIYRVFQEVSALRANLLARAMRHGELRYSTTTNRSICQREL